MRYHQCQGNQRGINPNPAPQLQRRPARTLEIATRARVSKRELYGLVGNKHQMLIACISERATRLRSAAKLPVPRDRETFEQVLVSFATQLVREISDPAVIGGIGVFPLAIAERPCTRRRLHARSTP